MSSDVLTWVYPVWGTLGSLDLGGYFLPILRKFSMIISSSISSCPFIFVFFFWDTYDLNVGAFNIVPEVSEVVFISFNSFSFFPLCFISFIHDQAERSWFPLIVASSLCGWCWTNGLSRFPGLWNLCLCSVGWNWSSSLWSAIKCAVVGIGVSMGLTWLQEAHLLIFKVVSLFCWRITMVCLALEPVGSWMELVSM